jgi:hypothetical protein
MYVRPVLNLDGFREHLSVDSTGAEAHRFYEVLAPDIASAAVQTGVPAMGEEWNAANPNLRVYRKVPEHLTCTPVNDQDSPTGISYTFKVCVHYRTPGAGGFNTPAPIGPGDKWTELEIGEVGASVMYGYDTDLGSDELQPFPIRNGDGAVVSTGSCTLVVKTFHDVSHQADLGRLLGLMQPAKLNLHHVEFPPLLREGAVYRLAPGQCLYRRFGMQMVGGGGPRGLLEISHHVQIARDFHEYWEKEDSRGRPNATVITRLYTAADFGGLW